MDFCDYPYIFMRDFLLFVVLSGQEVCLDLSLAAFHWSIIQVFQFTCCSDLIAFKFQVNKKTQNLISVNLQE